MALTAASAFESVLDTTTELGVSRIVPLFSQNAFYRHSDTPRLLGKYPRWIKILKESCKQSGNPFLPELANPISLEQLPPPTEKTPLYLAALEEPIQAWNLSKTIDSVGLLVGPEGDFSPEEYQKLNQLGVVFISLGQNVLRSQTAALAIVLEAQALINRLK
jgi:16S rRNA (uracil1498-N3)-methyltransferase